MKTSKQIQSQLNALRKQFRETPEGINGRANPKYYALKGKIFKTEKLLKETKQFEFEAL